MNLTWKKTAAMIIGGLVTASLVAPVLADTTTPTDQVTLDAKPGIHQFAPGMHMRGGKGGFLGGFFDGMGAKMGAMMRGGKGAPGMMMGQNQDQILADAAKGAGVTVEEYKAKLQADRQAAKDQLKAYQDQVLADAAKGAGVTVEEYKVQLKADRQAQAEHFKADLKAKAEQKLADAAAAANMTVEEYKAKLQTEHQNAMIERYAEKQGITIDEAKAQLKDQMANKMASQAKRFGITLEDLKAKFGQ